MTQYGKSQVLRLYTPCTCNNEDNATPMTKMKQNKTKQNKTARFLKSIFTFKEPPVLLAH
jgi:hypothetical protein